MLQITNQTIWQQTIDTALRNAKSSPRWTNAITRAVCEIEDNPFMHWDAQAGELIIWSQESSEIYIANGSCQCKAFTFHFACRHRAAARLYANYLAALSEYEQREADERERQEREESQVFAYTGRGNCCFCDKPIEADGSCPCSPRIELVPVAQVEMRSYGSDARGEQVTAYYCGAVQV